MANGTDISHPRAATVVGLGVSGRAVSGLLARRGVKVVATDARSREAFGDDLDALQALGCRLALGGHDLADFVETDLIVVSPGVPLTIEPLRRAREAGVRIVGELEWAWLQMHTPTVAVTGTNGKTTVTTLIGRMLKAAGRDAFVGGNIGAALSALLAEGVEKELLVLEISSFQLDTADHFRPDWGVLLNVSEDHLDRYESYRAYADSKFSMFQRQKPDQTAILNLDDSACAERAAQLPGRVLTYSRHHEDADAHVADHHLRVAVAGFKPFAFELHNPILRSVHNEENALATLLVGTSLGIPSEVLRGVLEDFQGLPHRMQYIATWRGVDFYNDSKATNVDAAVRAVDSFTRPVLLLAGGRDKLGSYEPLRRAAKGKVKGVFVYGESADNIARGLTGAAPLTQHENLAAAFEAAVETAEEGDVVLLSPACSSYDQYESYGRRGDHFRALVEDLPAH